MVGERTTSFGRLLSALRGRQRLPRRRSGRPPRDLGSDEPPRRRPPPPSWSPPLDTAPSTLPAGRGDRDLPDGRPDPPSSAAGRGGRPRSGPATPGDRTRRS